MTGTSHARDQRDRKTSSAGSAVFRCPRIKGSGQVEQRQDSEVAAIHRSKNVRNNLQMTGGDRRTNR